MSVEITPSYEPESGTWTYLLADPVQSVAAIIDPVWVFDPVSGRVSTQLIDALLNIAQQRNYRIEWVLETHAHADHLSSAGHIREKTGARIAIGRGICAVQKIFTRVFNLKDVATVAEQAIALIGLREHPESPAVVAAIALAMSVATSAFAARVGVLSNRYAAETAADFENALAGDHEPAHLLGERNTRRPEEPEERPGRR